MHQYLAQYGGQLMEVLLTIGAILGLYGILVAIMYVFRDDINSALKRWM